MTRSLLCAESLQHNASNLWKVDLRDDILNRTRLVVPKVSVSRNLSGHAISSVLE